MVYKIISENTDTIKTQIFGELITVRGFETLDAARKFALKCRELDGGTYHIIIDEVTE